MPNYPFIPYGKLTNGNYGINVDPSTTEPLVSAIESVKTLPLTNDPANFPGRTVFVTEESNVYTFSGPPSFHWMQLNKVSVVDVKNVNGQPPATPTPETGALVYDTIGGILYLWTGAGWVTVGGSINTVVVRDIYTGDGTTTTFGLSTTNPSLYEEMVFVDIDGVQQKPRVDYVLHGRAIRFGTAPSSGTSIQIRSFENVNASALPNYENRATVNAASYTPTATDSYIGVKYTTTGNVNIDLSDITALGSSVAGRKLTIKDEGGMAGTNNIVIVPGSLIDGAPTYTLSINYESVSLVFDGSRWFTW